MTRNSSRNHSDIIYISHGGGPLPLLGDRSHDRMVEFLKGLAEDLEKPDEVLVISAHWEEPEPTLYSASEQKLLYDYYGFPPEAYGFRYPTLPNQELVSTIRDSLSGAGFSSQHDTQRGLDHGVFVPLMIMYPKERFPVTQLSLVAGLDPSLHIRLGRALASLKNRKLLIIGSGFSFHNMRRFSMNAAPEPDETNDAFQDWLIRTCSATDEPQQMYEALESWIDAPGARYCHPREEHLLPLHVCAGLAGSRAQVVFDDCIAGKRSVAFRW